MTANIESTTEMRVGLVGTGSLGIRLGAAFGRLPSAELVAIADVNEESLAAAGRELDVDTASRYTWYEAMLEAEPLDAVAIATPNGLHYEQSIAALERGLDVLCEKPIATSVEDARDLTERAEASDRTVMLGYQRHLNPSFVEGRERWALGDLEPTFITAEITHDWREYYDGERTDNWRMDPELSGGGHLLNVGTHVIDAILWTTGLRPVAVTADIEFHDDADDGPQHFDRRSSMLIEFENGTTATFADTAVVPRTREHIHIWDDEGAIYFEGREWGGRTHKTIDADGTEHDPYPTGGQSKAEAFLKAVRTGSEPASTARDALRATVVTMAAYESGRRGERVELTDLYPFLSEETWGR